MTKKEKLEAAARWSGKLTSWQRPTPNRGTCIEWDENPDIPEMEEIREIEEREIAKVGAIVDGVQAESEAGNVVEMTVETTVESTS